jgi:hypothetical protein
MVSLKGVHFLKICQHTKFHGTKLTVGSFTTPQKFEPMGLRHGVEVTFIGIIPSEWHQNYQISSKVIKRRTQTER